VEYGKKGGGHYEVLSKVAFRLCRSLSEAWSWKKESELKKNSITGEGLRRERKMAVVGFKDPLRDEAVGKGREGARA